MVVKRSKGVTFWGDIFIILGVLYAAINSARNIWEFDYVVLPIVYVVFGIGILCLKNWARISTLAIAGLMLFSGIVGLPYWLQSLINLTQQGKTWFIFGALFFMIRFIIGVGAMIFFFQPAVKAQFKKGEQA